MAYFGGLVWQFQLTVALGCVLCFAGETPAQEIQDSFEVGPRFASVERADEWLRQTSVQAGEIELKISDFFARPQDGEIILAVLSDENMTRSVVVPISYIKNVTTGLEDDNLTLSKDLSDELWRASSRFLENNSYPVAVVRSFVAANFQDIKPDTIIDRVEGNAEVLRHRTLKGIGIVDKSESTIGHVEGIVVDPQGAKVAYLLIQLDDSQKLLPVPLGAFEYFYSDKRWKIDLAKDFIVRFPSIDAEQTLPTTLDRGWIEYVSVRFGRRSVQDAAATAERSDD